MDRLRSQVGPGPAQFFLDACALLAQRPPLPSVTHVVGHLFREIESALRAVLEGPVDGKAATGNRHRAKVSAILQELGVDADDIAAVYWLSFAGDDSPHNLAGRAHRSALDMPRPLDDGFLELARQFEHVLDIVLDRYEVHFVEVFRQIDQLLCIEAPTRSSAKTLRQNQPNVYAVENAFFGRASAAWLRPLAEEGSFGTPPSASVDEDGQPRYESWPVGDYLARIAADAPDDVVDVTLAVPPTDHPLVNRNIIQVALAVPPAAAARLVPTIIDGFGSKYGVRLPHEVGQLIQRLAVGGRAADGLTLATALLTYLLPTGSGSVGTYEYDLILRQHVPALVQAAGLPVLVLLCDLLDSALEMQNAGLGRAEGQDGSVIWRRRLEEDGGRGETDVEHALVNAVRDAAASLASTDEAATGAVVDELERRPWIVMRRLALHTLTAMESTGGTLVAARLCDRELAGDPHVEREVTALLQRRGTSCLGPADLSRVLALIDDAATLLDGMRDDEIALWTLERLHILRAVLPDAWQARYRGLVTRYGLPDGPDSDDVQPQRWQASMLEGPPVAERDLAAMPTIDLVEFLRTWQPARNDWRPLGPESLRGVLSVSIERDAARRSADGAAFIGLPAMYVGAVISGFWQAVQAGHEINWPGLVQLATWVDEEAVREISGGQRGDDRQWRRTRCDLLRLVGAALGRPADELPEVVETAIWMIIASSCADPDPSPAREATGPRSGPPRYLSLAGDVVRPLAVRAAIGFGMRLRRRDPDADLAAVLRLLDRHVDMWLDPSLAVRATFGERFPALLWMAPEWTKAQVTRIFPVGAGRLVLDAAWEGYLASGPVPQDAPNLLPEVYQVMVRQSPPAATDGGDWDPYFLLGCQLVLFLREGTLTLDGRDELLRTFYSTATSKVADRVMWVTGTTLDRAEIPAEEVEALVALWEWRAEQLTGSSNPAELANFGRWFVSGKFDADWSLRQLLHVVQHAEKLHMESGVLQRLAELAETYLSSCLAVLEGLVRRPDDRWRLRTGVDHVTTVLQRGFAGDAADQLTSRRLVSLLRLHHGVDLQHLLPTVAGAEAG